MTMTPTQREAALRLIAEFDAQKALRTVHAWPYDVVALLRELLAEQRGEPVAWHVCSVNSDGSLSLEFAARWEELAHEHISDAILDYDIEGAGSWVVRPVYASPRPVATEPTNCNGEK